MVKKLYVCYNSAIDGFVGVQKSGRKLWAFGSKTWAENNFAQELKLNPTTSRIVEITVERGWD